MFLSAPWSKVPDLEKFSTEVFSLFKSKVIIAAHPPLESSLKFSQMKH